MEKKTNCEKIFLHFLKVSRDGVKKIVEIFCMIKYRIFTKKMFLNTK